MRYDIKEGNDILIALHDQLYSGPLASYLDLTESYQPHMTLGRATFTSTHCQLLADR